MEIELVTPLHEQLKRDLSNKFTTTSSYIGSYIRKTIMESDFKILKQNSQPPTHIRKGDVIVLAEGAKTRPCVITKVLKDRTVIYMPLTSTDNLHCLTSFKSRFFGEGCFSKNFGLCTEEKAISSFVGVFDNMVAVNQAIKDLRKFFIINF